jgi:hypothetical protein
VCERETNWCEETERHLLQVASQNCFGFTWGVEANSVLLNRERDFLFTKLTSLKNAGKSPFHSFFSLNKTLLLFVQ